MVALFALVVMAPAVASAQSVAIGQDTLGVAYSDSVRVGADHTIRLRPFLLPGTLELYLGPQLWQGPRDLDPVRGIVSTPGLEPGTSVLASYRALPLEIQTEYELDRQPIAVAPVDRSRRGGSVPASPTSPGLRSRGSISRGVIAGSSRDVTIESGLRLELDGELAPGLEVRASLSDAESPIRPDGSTQRLSEFDRVFVQMTARSGRVVLGDFDGSLSKSRFAGLSRKLQGAMIHASGSTDGMDVRVSAAGATSRGELQVQTIPAIDGVQGPYRLEGAAGERFVLVLPGSERVYVDGRLLVRGDSEDYILDYSLGELTFTGRQIITADSRITVEFQYSTNQFTRTLVATEVDVGFGRQFLTDRRFSLGASWIREADTGEFLSEFGLTSADSLSLAGAGDSTPSRSGAQQVVYDPEARYAQYMVENRGADSIFVAVESRPAPETAVYRVQFSRIGASQGSYSRDAQSLNGIAYRYVGAGLGEYEPVRLLPRPGLKSVLDLRGRFLPVAGIAFDAEVAQSLNDRNRLSALDSDDDRGRAFSIGLKAETPRSAAGRVWVTLAANRATSDFSTFERYREVEFARRWNITSFAVPATSAIAGSTHEQELSGAVAWDKGDSLGLNLSASRLDIPLVFQAERLQGSFRGLFDHFPSLRVDVTGVRSEDDFAATAGDWFNGVGRIEDSIRRVQLALEIEAERRMDRRGDSLSTSSIRYTEVRPSATYEAGPTRLSAALERRAEALPIMGTLNPAATSWTISTRAETTGKSSFRSDLEVGWRSRRVRPSFGESAGGSDTNALLVNTTGGASLGIATLDWLYDARTERTPVLQEIYLRAGPELGAYVWEDSNGDDVVQLDELLPETTPNEGTYIRTFLPSDSLASVNSVRARVNARFRPVPTGDERFRWSTRTLVEIQEQSRSESRLNVYLLHLPTFRERGLTTAGRLRVRQDANISHPESGASIDASFQLNRSLNELSSGVETRAGEIAELQLGYRISPGVQTALRGALERDETNSDRFASRRFSLRTRSLRPSITVRSGRFVTQTALDVSRKEDRLAGRNASLVRIPASVRWSRAGRNDVLARFEVSRVDLSGAAVGGLAEFELTDGRGEGTAFLWGLTAQWSLSGSLRATVAYDGRAPSGRDVIHTGRVQMSAVF